MNAQLEKYILPIAMLIGLVFSNFFALLSPIVPYLIFTMLFITFSRVDPKKIKFKKWHIWLLLFQSLVGIILYLLLRRFDEQAAQGILICVLAPTATASVVIAQILGGYIPPMVTFSLLSNLLVAIFAPIVFSFIGTLSEIDFIDSSLLIFKKVGPLLLLPFIVAMILRAISKKAIKVIGHIQKASLYIWSLSLMIVIGQTVKFVRDQSSTNYIQIIYIALASLAVCLIQFVIGRAIGRHYGDTVSVGQSLGQKNTILAIWMAQTYLMPLASIAPASYVLWQNCVNSYQIWLKKRKESTTNHQAN